MRIAHGRHALLCRWLALGTSAWVTERRAHIHWRKWGRKQEFYSRCCPAWPGWQPQLQGWRPRSGEVIQAWVGLWVLRPSPTQTGLIPVSGTEARVLLGREWRRVCLSLPELNPDKPQSDTYPVQCQRKIRLRRERARGPYQSVCVCVWVSHNWDPGLPIVCPASSWSDQFVLREPPPV